MTSSLLTFVRATAYVLLALLLCSVLFRLSGYSSWAIFAGIAQGAVLSHGAVENSVRWAVPLFITAVGVVITFRCGYFNIGAQGQFYCGAIGAALVADAFGGAMPFLVVPAALIAGILGGMAWASWPAWLRLRFGADEVITTLMGNFIAALLLLYVTSTILKDPTGSGEVSAARPINAALRISSSLGVSWQIVGIATLLGVAAMYLLRRTTFGVLSGLAGRNPVMVTWQGARSAHLGYIAFALSGGLAGIAGSIELLGPDGRLVGGFAPNVGFSALLVALVGNLAISGTLVSALFFGGLAAASLYLPVIAGLPSAAIDLINAAITLLVTARAWPTNIVTRWRSSNAGSA